MDGDEGMLERGKEKGKTADRDFILKDCLMRAQHHIRLPLLLGFLRAKTVWPRLIDRCTIKEGGRSEGVENIKDYTVC